MLGGEEKIGWEGGVPWGFVMEVERAKVKESDLGMERY